MRRRDYCYTRYEMVSDKKKDRHTLLLTIAILLILTIGIVLIIHVDHVCKQQINIMNTIKEIQLENEISEAAEADSYY